VSAEAQREGGFIKGWRLDLSDPDTPNGFDALRFIAATLVLVGHSWPLTGRKPEPFPAAGIRWAASASPFFS
jgi:peptidoglycan/LPS O-acetylase OafA/YrhL